MKLSGPSGPGIRFVLGLHDCRAVLTGTFPPERAIWLRVVAQMLADEAHPLLRADYDRDVQRRLDEIIHGTGIGEPRGILTAPSMPKCAPARPLDPSPIWTGGRRPSSQPSILGFPVVESETVPADEIRFVNRQPVELDAFERDGKTVFTLRAVRP